MSKQAKAPTAKKKGGGGTDTPAATSPEASQALNKRKASSKESDEPKKGKKDIVPEKELSADKREDVKDMIGSTLAKGANILSHVVHDNKDPLTAEFKKLCAVVQPSGDEYTADPKTQSEWESSIMFRESGQRSSELSKDHPARIISDEFKAAAWPRPYVAGYEDKSVAELLKHHPKLLLNAYAAIKPKPGQSMCTKGMAKWTTASFWVELHKRVNKKFAELHVGATINLRGLAGKAASIHDSIYNHESTKVKFNLDVTQKRTAAAAAAAAAAAPAPSSGGFLPPLQLAAPHFAPMFAGAGTYVQPPPGWTVAMVPIESVAQCQRMW